MELDFHPMISGFASLGSSHLCICIEIWAISKKVQMWSESAGKDVLGGFTSPPSFPLHLLVSFRLEHIIIIIFGVLIDQRQFNSNPYRLSLNWFWSIKNYIHIMRSGSISPHHFPGERCQTPNMIPVVEHGFFFFPWETNRFIDS
jgi:hypothetical protein